ncbi:MAG: asparagine synthase (glutamine-hydrolyzing) [Casimicrobiaceae bacterium]
MCGIAGIIPLTADPRPVDRARLRAMSERLVHRGPDGAGEWFSADGTTALGHRRLAIIDLTEAGAQPMWSASGRHVIVFNGEIYNYRSLRRALESEGVRFRSTSDTEVLLEGLERHGEAFLSELRGMFALALHEPARRRTLLARDSFGIKPLYWSQDASHLHFASQVQAFMAAGLVGAPSPVGRAGYLLWGSVPEPWTWWTHIHALPAGHLLRIEAGRPIRPEPFLTVQSLLARATPAAAPADRGDAVEQVAAAIRESITAHRIADVPVAVFLSAGLDSSMLACASAGYPAATDGTGTIRSITLGFDALEGTPEDEVPLAREIAAAAGVEFNPRRVGRHDFSASADVFHAEMDQPTIDGINTWFVSRSARHLGMKIALSGLGGDELLASYPSFRQLPAYVRRTAWARALRPLGRALRRVAAPWLGQITSPKYAGLLEHAGDWAGGYLLRRALFMPWEIERMMGEEGASALEALDTLARLRASINGIDNDRLKVTALELQWYMRNQLLRDADWAGMAHSLEIRVPFVDVDLVRCCADVFARHPDIGKAEVAARVAPELPPVTLERPKTGFVAPVRAWLAQGTGLVPGRGLRGWAQHCAARYLAAAGLAS